MFQCRKRRKTGREYSLHPFALCSKLMNLPPFQSHVWPAVPPPLASIRTQHSFLDLPRTEEDQTESQGVMPTPPVTSNQLGQLSLMVSTTAIDCRNTLSGCRDYVSG